MQSEIDFARPYGDRGLAWDERTIVVRPTEETVVAGASSALKRGASVDEIVIPWSAVAEVEALHAFPFVRIRASASVGGDLFLPMHSAMDSGETRLGAAEARSTRVT